MTTQAVNFFVNFLGIKSSLLLGLSGKDRPKIFAEVLNYLVNNGGYKLLNELALIREKELEKEVTNSLSSIRDRVRKRYDQSKKFQDNSESFLINKMSELSKVSLIEPWLSCQLYLSAVLYP